MKKLLISLLSVAVIFTLCACGNNDAAGEPGETAYFTEDVTVVPETPANSEAETVQPTAGTSTTPPTEVQPAPVPTEAPQPTCNHSWKAATCTAAKTCSKCGQVSGSSLGHSYQKATCTAPKTCKTCGHTYGSALGHSWNDATCQGPKTCSTCGTTEGNPLVHSWQDATCQAPKTCGTCGKTEGEPGNCAWSDATCKEPKTCSICGATEGEALGHNWQDATCQAPKTCSICSETEGEVGGCIWTDATCQAPKTCSVCKATTGSVSEHIVDGTTCKWCKQVVPVDPSNFNAGIPYSCIGKRHNGEPYHWPDNSDCYVLTILNFGGETSSQAVYDSALCPYEKDGHLHFHHNGNYYDSIAQSAGLYGETTYSIVDGEIVVTVPVLKDYSISGSATIHFQFLSNGTLKVSSLSGTAIPEIAGINIGAIFYPNPNPWVSYE